MASISADAPSRAPVADADQPSWIPRTALDGSALGRNINVEKAIARYGAKPMQAIFDGFLTCDEKAMAVVIEYSALKGGHRMMMEHLDQALDHGIDTVVDPQPALVTLFEALDTVPEWVDWDQLYRGAVAYFRPGGLVSLTFTCAGVAAGNYGYGVTRPQALTGRFEEKAYTRSAETFRWLLAATTPGAMARYGEGFRLSVRVRVLHAFVRIMVTKSPRWDWDNWGMPINDSDQAWEISATFTTVLINAYGKIGIRFSKQETDDIYALFRYIGYILGTPDHLNPKNGAEAVLYDKMWTTVDRGPDEGCIRLVKALIDLAAAGDETAAEAPKTLMGRIMTPARTRDFMYGMCRFWAGDKICDGLDLPNTRWRYAGYLVKPFVMFSELKRSLFSADDEGIGNRTREGFKAGVKIKAGETDIATPDDIIAGIADRAAKFAVRAG